MIDLGIYDNYADLIFNKIYKVRVPILSTYTEGELDVMGIRMNTFEEDKNRPTHNEYTLVMITIIDMVKKFNDGFPIRVVDEKDVQHIYDVIQAHLRTWKSYQVASLNQAAPDLDDDLIAMDKFAHEIFGLNKTTIVGNDLISKPMYNIPFSSHLMGNSKPEVKDVDISSIERESMAPEKKRTTKYSLNDLLMH